MCCGPHVEVKEQPGELVLPFLHIGSRVLAQIVRFDSKHLYPLKSLYIDILKSLVFSFAFYLCIYAFVYLFMVSCSPG